MYAKGFCLTSLHGPCHFGWVPNSATKFSHFTCTCVHWRPADFYRWYNVPCKAMFYSVIVWFCRFTVFTAVQEPASPRLSKNSPRMSSATVLSSELLVIWLRRRLEARLSRHGQGVVIERKIGAVQGCMG